MPTMLQDLLHGSGIVPTFHGVLRKLVLRFPSSTSQASKPMWAMTEQAGSLVLTGSQVRAEFFL